MLPEDIIFEIAFITAFSTFLDGGKECKTEECMIEDVNLKRALEDCRGPSRLPMQMGKYVAEPHRPADALVHPLTDLYIDYARALSMAYADDGTSNPLVASHRRLPGGAHIAVLLFKRAQELATMRDTSSEQAFRYYVDQLFLRILAGPTWYNSHHLLDSWERDSHHDKSDLSVEVAVKAKMHICHDRLSNVSDAVAIKNSEALSVYQNYLTVSEFSILYGRDMTRRLAALS
jgi:hypothetical protein